MLSEVAVVGLVQAFRPRTTGSRQNEELTVRLAMSPLTSHRSSSSSRARCCEMHTTIRSLCFSHMSCVGHLEGGMHHGRQKVGMLHDP
jgi:hypothetical protein